MARQAVGIESREDGIGMRFETNKTKILSTVRKAAANYADSKAHKKNLQEKACLIPDYLSLKQLIEEDMHAAYREDKKIGEECKARNRARTGMRVTASRKFIWEQVFEHVAPRFGLAWADIDIRSIGRQGIYSADLIDKEEKESEFERALRVLEEHGVAKAKTEALYLSEQMQAAASLVRSSPTKASGQSNASTASKSPSRESDPADTDATQLLCDRNLQVLEKIARSDTPGASQAKKILAAFQRAIRSGSEEATSTPVRSSPPKRCSTVPCSA